jgi:hypothetical protein
MQAIEQTPPSASVAKATIPTDTEDAGRVEAEESQPQCHKLTNLYQM